MLRINSNSSFALFIAIYCIGFPSNHPKYVCVCVFNADENAVSTMIINL